LGQSGKNKNSKIMKKKNVLLAVVASLSLATAGFAQNVPSYVPSNGLVGWWPFNGNANDESENGNNGTVNGATLTKDRFGNLNQAFSFDGVNDNIDILDNFNSGSFSISVWSNSAFNSSFCNPCNAIVSKINNPNQYTNFELRGPNIFLFGEQNDYNSLVFSSDKLSLGVWYNVSLSFDSLSKTAKIYLNGILQESLSDISISNESNEPVSVGARPISGDLPFKGQLDDIGIWNRALTQQEITNLYNSNLCYQTVTVTDTLVINLGITGYNPVTYSNSIKIYPNPANDHITIDYGHYTALSGHQIVIKNATGQQMFQSAITQQSSYINLGSWSGKGLYFVHILDPKGNTLDIRKIVLQ
jgi:hypothetical protein